MLEIALEGRRRVQASPVFTFQSFLCWKLLWKLVNCERPVFYNSVSILLMLEIALEVTVPPSLLPIALCFNPSYAGNCSGSSVPLALSLWNACFNPSYAGNCSGSEPVSVVAPNAKRFNPSYAGNCSGSYYNP